MIWIPPALFHIYIYDQQIITNYYKLPGNYYKFYIYIYKTIKEKKTQNPQLNAQVDEEADYQEGMEHLSE